MATDQTNLAEQFHRSTGSYELALSPVIFALFGLYLDRRLGTSPWIMISFTLFAVVGAAVSARYRYRHEIARLNAQTAELKAKAKEGRG